MGSSKVVVLAVCCGLISLIYIGYEFIDLNVDTLPVTTNGSLHSEDTGNSSFLVSSRKNNIKNNSKNNIKNNIKNTSNIKNNIKIILLIARLRTLITS
eukprot:305005_1